MHAFVYQLRLMHFSIAHYVIMHRQQKQHSSRCLNCAE